MYQIVALVFAAIVGVSHASYLAPALPVAHAPLLAAGPITTSAHVGNVVSGVSRSYSNVPHTRFTRTDWNQPGKF